MANLLDELIAIEESCAKAFNKKDLDSLLKNFSEKISGFSSTEHDRFQGQAELKKTFEYYLAEADNVTYEIMNPVATDLGEIDILSFYWRVTLNLFFKWFDIIGYFSLDNHYTTKLIKRFKRKLKFHHLDTVWQKQGCSPQKYRRTKISIQRNRNFL